MMILFHVKIEKVLVQFEIISWFKLLQTYSHDYFMPALYYKQNLM